VVARSGGLAAFVFLFAPFVFFFAPPETGQVMRETKVLQIIVVTNNSAPLIFWAIIHYPLINY
jgi:hypothetical protein